MLKPYPDTLLEARDPISLQTSKARNETVVDFERENRLSQKFLHIALKILEENSIAFRVYEES